MMNPKKEAFTYNEPESVLAVRTLCLQQAAHDFKGSVTGGDVVSRAGLYETYIFGGLEAVTEALTHSA